MSTPPSTFLIALGWSTDKPCISHMYCSRVRLRTSCSLRGQLNFPSSSRLYSRINPSASHSSTLRRSLRLPQNRNALLEKRSSLYCCWTMAASPSMDFLISVCPQTTAIFSLLWELLPEHLRKMTWQKTIIYRLWFKYKFGANGVSMSAF